MRRMESEGVATPFLASAQDGGKWPDSLPGRFNHGKEGSVCHWTGGSVAIGTVCFAPTGNRTLVVQLIIYRYTDWAIPALATEGSRKYVDSVVTDRELLSYVLDGRLTNSYHKTRVTKYYTGPRIGQIFERVLRRTPAKHRISYKGKFLDKLV
jgi:hypothetical protein